MTGQWWGFLSHLPLVHVLVIALIIDILFELTDAPDKAKRG